MFTVWESLLLKETSICFSPDKPREEFIFGGSKGTGKALATYCYEKYKHSFDEESSAFAEACGLEVTLLYGPSFKRKNKSSPKKPPQTTRNTPP